VAALLECARVLDTVRLKRTIEYVVFDMEEEGLVGSTAFVRDEASSTGYDGVYNLEMMVFTSGTGTQRFPPGFDLLFPEVHQHLDERGFTSDLLVVTSMSQSAALGRCMAVEAASYVPDLDVVSLELNARMRLPPDFFRSDHASFWEAEISAVMVTDTANFRNPNYHTAGDTADTLDYGFLHKVTRVLVATVSGHAQD
jgi:Zn-dependent M28 family amino/carboxypeptidase